MDSESDRRSKIDDMIVTREIHSPLDAGGFGFNGKRIVDAAMRPNATGLIKWDDLLIEICTKSIGDRTDVIGIGTNSDPWELMFAFEVYPDLDERPIGELTPLQIVKSLAERFGLVLSIGGETGKFFLAQDFIVRVHPRVDLLLDQVIGIQNPDGRSHFLVRGSRIDGNVVRVAMAFCIEHARYREWVGDRV